MRTAMLKPRNCALMAAAVLGIAAGCRPKPPETPPAPVPPAPEIGAIQGMPEAQRIPVSLAATGPAATDAVTAAPDAPPPALESMHLAAPGSKIGVPVDLRYQFTGSAEPGRPATLHLAAVPRVPGSNLTVSIKETPGIEAAAPPITAQKASAQQAYRQQLSVTRHAGAPSELRVLVMMELPEGSAFGYYSVPLGNARAAAQ